MLYIKKGDKRIIEARHNLNVPRELNIPADATHYDGAMVNKFFKVVGEQRLARWEAQKKENRKEMLTNAFIIFPVSLLCLFVGSHLYDVAFDLNLIGKGVLIASLLMIPLILIQQSKPYNRKPTQADVEADIKLRKAFKMDSRVND